MRNKPAPLAYSGCADLVNTSSCQRTMSAGVDSDSDNEREAPHTQQLVARSPLAPRRLRPCWPAKPAGWPKTPLGGSTSPPYVAVLGITP